MKKQLPCGVKLAVFKQMDCHFFHVGNLTPNIDCLCAFKEMGFIQACLSSMFATGPPFYLNIKGYPNLSIIS